MFGYNRTFYTLAICKVQSPKLQVVAKFYIKGSIDPIQPIFDTKTYYYREFHLFILLYEFQLYILHIDRYFR